VRQLFRQRRIWTSLKTSRASKRQQICLHLLAFIFPNRAFSMGYGRFK
jgi:hypothetical protein